MGRCVNCALLLVPPLPIIQVAQASDAILDFLRSWIDPVNLSPNDVVCEECFIILKNEEIKGSSVVEAVRRYGHNQVCLVCGKFMLKKQIQKVRLGSSEWIFLISIIPIQQVHRLEKVCLRCWNSAYKRMLQKDQHKQTQAIDDERNVTSIMEQEISPDIMKSSLEPSITSEELIRAIACPPLSQMPSSPPVPKYQSPNTLPIINYNPKIRLRDYKRVTALKSKCIFKYCYKTKLKRVPSVIQEKSLFHHRLYIPDNVLVCNNHLNSALWNGLLQLGTWDDSFTGSEIDNMLSILEKGHRCQFESPNFRIMNPGLCKF